jgi:23S rRNA pseudouridine1911/1915/1917 synthase
LSPAGQPVLDLSNEFAVNAMTIIEPNHNSVRTSTMVACAESVGRRLDHFLREKLPEMSRSQIQRMIASGEIQVDGVTVKPGQKLRGQEIITFHPAAVAPVGLLPEPIPLEILYEDEDLAIINKPAGLVVHSGAGIRSGTLVNALLYHFQQLSQAWSPQRPGIVHRLDKETSGLMLVAKNDYAHFQLARQFQSRQVAKTYIALVHGRIEIGQGEITSPIGRDRVRRVKMTTRTARAREASTQYQVLERFERFTLLRVNIKTGRTHQIRVHLSSLKHPIVGDRLYGAPAMVLLPGQKHWQPTMDRNFLHAAELEISHPRTMQRLKFESPLPEELSQFLLRLRQNLVLRPLPKERA